MWKMQDNVGQEIGGMPEKRDVRMQEGHPDEQFAHRALEVAVNRGPATDCAHTACDCWDGSLHASTAPISSPKRRLDASRGMRRALRLVPGSAGWRMCPSANNSCPGQPPNDIHGASPPATIRLWFMQKRSISIWIRPTKSSGRMAMGCSICLVPGHWGGWC